MAGIRKGTRRQHSTQHTGVVHRWKSANHSPGQTKSDPNSPHSSEKLKNQDDSPDASRLRLHKSGGNGKPRADLGAGHMAVETQTD